MIPVVIEIELAEGFRNNLIRWNIMFTRLQHTIQERRAQFEGDYRKFAKMRGFKTFNDYAYHRRGFIECWAQLMRHWSYSVIVAFSCFGVLTVLSRKLSHILKQERWPWIVNTFVNIGLVIGSFDIGFRIDRLLS
jgi:hypothetical protein